MQVAIVYESLFGDTHEIAEAVAPGGARCRARRTGQLPAGRGRRARGDPRRGSARRRRADAHARHVHLHEPLHGPARGPDGARPSTPTAANPPSGGAGRRGAGPAHLVPRPAQDGEGPPGGRVRHPAGHDALGGGRARDRAPAARHGYELVAEPEGFRASSSPRGRCRPVSTTERGTGGGDRRRAAAYATEPAEPVPAAMRSAAPAAGSAPGWPRDPGGLPVVGLSRWRAAGPRRSASLTAANLAVPTGLSWRSVVTARPCRTHRRGVRTGAG